MPIPLLILSDAPTCRSGLGRITRDLATRIATDMPEFRVATLGLNGTGSNNLPFFQYPINGIDTRDWIVSELPHAWHDHAGSERGILLCIWDISRLDWLVNPPKNLSFAKWLKTKPFDIWSYSALDAEGPNGRMPEPLQKILNGCDRVLNYSKWASGVTMYPDWLPHGIDTSAFCRRENAKQKFRDYGFTTLKDSSLLIGIVATNQPRKDWALGIQTASLLRGRGHDVRLWCHTDVVRRHWDINLMLREYGLTDIAAVTTDVFPDEQMAEFYSACDVTLAPSSEGFGLPIYESLACGTPCIHHRYAGGAEWLPEYMAIPPDIYRHEGIYCWKRPVGDPETWANLAENITNPVLREIEGSGLDASLPSCLDWNNLWPKWKQWLLEGIDESSDFHSIRHDASAVGSQPSSV